MTGRRTDAGGDEGRYLSITELARIHNVSTDTLRFYDRIGLLKPAARRGGGGVRYYSINPEDDRLGTIVELRRLGMSLEDIKRYLDHRTLRGSYDLLVGHRNALDQKIEELVGLRDQLGRQIDALHKALDTPLDFDRVRLEERPERQVIIAPSARSSTEELYRDSVWLDRELGVNNSVLASVRYALLFEGSPERARECHHAVLAGAGTGERGRKRQGEGEARPGQVTLPAGSYVCLYTRGIDPDYSDAAHLVQAYCDEHGLRAKAPWVRIVLVDFAVTDDPTEYVCDLQVRVEG